MDDNAGVVRFQEYVAGFADRDSTTRFGYPAMPARPWHDPSQFPVVTYLEDNFAAIKDELLSISPQSYHQEAELIQRTGAWDVVFFYERGIRRTSNCEQCPVTTHAIEDFPVIRDQTGLCFLSRMRPGTHAQPHEGPTTLRVRLHLPIVVPGGDCAIRVGGEARRWEEGRCMVFDDRFEHEAWNRGDGDRIVLILDLWNPELTPDEVELLRGLHAYSLASTRSLMNYWSRNAKAEPAVD